MAGCKISRTLLQLQRLELAVAGSSIASDMLLLEGLRDHRYGQGHVRCPRDGNGTSTLPTQRYRCSRECSRRMHQDKEVAAEDVTVVMTQVSLMGTVRERPPGSGGWIVVPGLSYLICEFLPRRGKGGCEKILQSSRRGLRSYGSGATLRLP